jgi:hypothetical protein
MTIWLADSCKTNLKYVADAMAPERAQILISYHYFQDHDIPALFADCEPKPRVFLDSGAFSAATQGAVISVGKYADYLERNLPHLEVYVNLDVIGDHAKTRANQRYLERRGLQPLPVFHAHEPWDVLRELVAEYDYIALGGIAIKGTAHFGGWIKRCFEMAGDTRIHGLGVSDWTLLRAFPWHSVDHTSWGQGFRYGQVPIFDPQRGRFVKVWLRDREKAWRCSRLLYQYGVSPNDTALWTRAKRPALCRVAARSWMAAQDWLTRWHEQHDGKERITKEVELCPN